MTAIDYFNELTTHIMSKEALDTYSEFSPKTKENFRDLLEASEIFDLLPLGVYIETLDGTFLYVNEYFAKKIGTTTADICLRKNLYELTHPDDHESFREYLEDLRVGKDRGWCDFNCSVQCLCTDGLSHSFEQVEMVRCKTRARVLTAEQIEELLSNSLSVDTATISKMKMFASNSEPLVVGIVLFEPCGC